MHVWVAKTTFVHKTSEERFAFTPLQAVDLVLETKKEMKNFVVLVPMCRLHSMHANESESDDRRRRELTLLERRCVGGGRFVHNELLILQFPHSAF